MLCRSLASSGLAITTLFLATPLTGCFAYGRRNADVDRTPEMHTGVAATVIYPSQGAPMLSPNIYAPESAAAMQGAPAPAGAQAAPGAGLGGTPTVTRTPTGTSGSGSTYGVPGGAPAPVPQGAPAPTPGSPPPAPGPESSGATAPSGGGVAMLGGTHQDEKKHIRYEEDPLHMKALLVPFALIAAPFKYAADKLRPEPAPGPALPPSQPTGPTVQNTQPSAPPDYETAMIRKMERELALRQQQAGAAPPAPSVAAQPTARASLSIADELAELQRAPAAPPAPRASLATPAPGTVSPAPADGASLAAADGIIDRDGDGRVDQWIFREEGWIAREALDENFDGRPDRTLVYDAESHEVARVEEDTDHDGRLDAWTEYKEGALVRRRSDADGDGMVDTWTFYRDGEVVRLERDTTGDGFRNRVSLYEKGRLVREERDRNGDGALDVATVYDEAERPSRREEDTNGDGRFDVVSFYEDGRLARREILDPSAPPPEVR